LSKPATSQKLTISGPAGQLEALLDVPAAAPPRGAVVVCHPHPQHGGTMHNKVAHTLARAFSRADFAALRFNFRGTEGSEGKYDDGNGELDDALAVIEWMRDEHPGLAFWVAGFSFGAAIAVRAAAAVQVDGLVSVAPAIYRFAAGLKTQPACPWLVVQGDDDELVDVEETIDWINGLEPGPELLVMQGVEHFFHGNLVQLREVIINFVEKHSG